MGDGDRDIVGGRCRPTSSSDTSPDTTARGSMFHRPECVVVKGRSDLQRVTGDEKGLKPCKICDPLGEAATAST